MANPPPQGWIGVDLDGTLAEYHGWKGAEHVGEPIPVMVERVKAWLAAGQEVRIFTARISHDCKQRRMLEAAIAQQAIMKWCQEHIGQALPVTCMKDFRMIELWDDRAIQVVKNTGERV